MHAQTHTQNQRECYSLVLVLFLAERRVLFCTFQSDSNRQNSPRPRYCNHTGCIKSYTKPAPNSFLGPLRRFAPSVPPVRGWWFALIKVENSASDAQWSLKWAAFRRVCNVNNKTRPCCVETPASNWFRRRALRWTPAWVMDVVKSGWFAARWAVFQHHSLVQSCEEKSKDEGIIIFYFLFGIIHIGY